MGKLIKGPFTIEINGEMLHGVCNFEYKNKVLTLKYYVTDYEKTVDLLYAIGAINTIRVEGYTDEDGKYGEVVFEVASKYDAGLTIEDQSVLVGTLEFRVKTVRINEVKNG